MPNNNQNNTSHQTSFASTASNISTFSTSSLSSPATSVDSMDTNNTPQYASSGKNSQAPHRMIGKYLMQETVGRGGFSTVKKGLDLSVNPHLRVALKLVPRLNMLNGNSSNVKQVKAEIEALARISHPHVLRMFEYLEDAQYMKRNGKMESVMLLVLEYAPGSELFDILAYTGKFSETLARTYFHQLINGVGYCHQHGIVHRDLKPENLLLDEHYMLKVADFGLSSVLDNRRGDARGQLMYTECGTPSYMAPEVFTRQGYNPVFSDIWSCAVILFIMVAGFPPFQRPSLTDWWFNKLATNRPNLFWQAHTRSAQFSPAFVDFLTRLLQPEANKRMTIADMTSHEWMCGETLSPADLDTEMRRRKQIINEDQLKITAQKEKQRMEEQNTNQRFTLGDETKHRALYDEDDAAAIDGDDETLPEGTPDLALQTVAPIIVEAGKGGGTLLSIEDLDRELDEENEGAGSSDKNDTSESSLGENVQLPLYDPKDDNNTFTSFRSNLPLTELFAAIHATISANHFTVKVSSTTAHITATVQTALGALVIGIQIYKTDESGAGEKVVEFRRWSGDGSQYRAVYGSLLLQMEELRVKNEDNSTTSTLVA